MSRRARAPLLLLVAALVAVACQRAPRRAVCELTGARPLPYAPLLERARSEDPEVRYHALVALGRHDSPVVRASLRRHLEDPEPIVRNAAARALVDLGEEDAAAAWIANLHRDRRTYVTTDAVHHLRECFGTGLGYDPNLGYRHQGERQTAWWAWWEARGHVRPPTPADEDPNAARRPALAAQVDAFVAASEGADDAVWPAAKELWAALGTVAPSRHPGDVALVARGFGALTRRFPDHVALANNHALSSLNAGAWDEAEASYRRAVALAPDDADLANDFGILLEGRGRLEDALASYDRAIRIAPEDDVAIVNRADVLATLGRTGEARAAYRRAEALAPEKWYYHRLWIERLPP